MTGAARLSVAIVPAFLASPPTVFVKDFPGFLRAARVTVPAASLPTRGASFPLAAEDGEGGDGDADGDVDGRT